MPLGQFGAGGAGKQPQHEFRGLLRGQVAGVVQAHKFVVAPPRLFRIASAPGAGKEIGPLIVAVHREQSVVQVEKGKPLGVCQGVSGVRDWVEASRSFKRGRVMARCSWTARSEEHTSELQSLMRTSYAVFCSKHKHTPAS